MEQYLIDTSVVSAYLSATLPSGGLALMDRAIDAVPKISIITQIELLCWNTDAFILQNIKDFIADSIVLNISQEIVTECVRTRRNKKIKTPDAIIAATALVHSCTLITNTEKDFDNIKGLRIVNPFMIG